MPRGKRINLQMREIICPNIVENNFTVDQLFAALFDNDPARCSLEYIQKLGRFLRRDLRFREQYLCGGRLPVGRSFSQDVTNRIMIRQHVPRLLCNVLPSWKSSPECP